MKEDSLKGIWNKGDDNAKKYFEEIEESVLEKVQKSSNDVLQKVKRNAIAELIASVIIVVCYLFYFSNFPNFSIIGAILILLLALTIWFYVSFLTSIKKAEKSSVLDTLKAKLSILKKYVKWMTLLIYIFSPVAFYFGFSFSFFQTNEIGSELAIAVIISLPFLFAFIWGCKKYLHWLYGKNIEKLTAIVDGLENEA